MVLDGFAEKQKQINTFLFIFNYILLHVHFIFIELFFVYIYKQWKSISKLNINTYIDKYKQRIIFHHLKYK